METDEGTENYIGVFVRLVLEGLVLALGTSPRTLEIDISPAGPLFVLPDLYMPHLNTCGRDRPPLVPETGAKSVFGKVQTSLASLL
jgi:hypothetical protein